MTTKENNSFLTRAAMTLLVGVFAILSSATEAWAQNDDEEEGIDYYDPTAETGQQMKKTTEWVVLSEGTLDYSDYVLGEEDTENWYYVDEDISIEENRLEVKGTVNIILKDGCTFEALRGIRVPQGSMLNIYAQKAGEGCGQLIASAEGSDDAAIGGNGGTIEMKSGEAAGTITIYGGHIAANGNIGGGNSCSKEEKDGDDFDEEEVAGEAGDGGDFGTITIYGGTISVTGSIGGGNGGEDGYDGSGSIILSWTNSTDIIHTHSFCGNIELLKDFVDNDDSEYEKGDGYSSDIFEDDITLKPLRKYTVTFAGYDPPCLEIDGISTPIRAGEEVTLLAINGYNVNTVTVTADDGTIVGVTRDYVDDSWSFTMPAQNVTITAEATRKYYNISWVQHVDINIDEDEMDPDKILEQVSGTYYMNGATIPFTVEVEDYLEIESVSVNYTDDNGVQEVSCIKVADGCYSFVMPEHDVTISVSCQQIAFMINYDEDYLEVSANATNVVTDGIVDYFMPEAEITVTSAYHSEGMVLKSLKVTQEGNIDVGCISDNNGSYTFVMPSANVAISACYAISLADATNNDDIISTAADSQKQLSVTLNNRTLHKNDLWNTLCLPFNLSAEQLADAACPLKDAVIMTLSSSEFAGGTLTLKFEAAESIEAGMPYIVKWKVADGAEGTTLDNPVFEGVTVYECDDDEAVETDYVDFIGSFSPVSLEANDKSSLYLSAGNTLYYPLESMNIGSCRAYFRLKNGITAGESATGVRAFVLDFSDEHEGEGTQGISEAEANSSRSSLSEWFTIDGRHFSGKPSVSGLYIHRGKKIVVP